MLVESLAAALDRSRGRALPQGNGKPTDRHGEPPRLPFDVGFPRKSACGIDTHPSCPPPSASSRGRCASCGDLALGQKDEVCTTDLAGGGEWAGHEVCSPIPGAVPGSN